MIQFKAFSTNIFSPPDLLGSALESYCGWPTMSVSSMSSLIHLTLTVRTGYYYTLVNNKFTCYTIQFLLNRFDSLDKIRFELSQLSLPWGLV